jgi:3-dehydroquinate synthetase
VEARIAHALGLTADDTVRALDDAVHALGLATRPPDTIDPEALLGATRGDKKAMHGSVRYALPTRIGAMHAADGAWALPVSDDVVRAALRA